MAGQAFGEGDMERLRSAIQVLVQVPSVHCIYMHICMFVYIGNMKRLRFTVRVLVYVSLYSIKIYKCTYMDVHTFIHRSSIDTYTPKLFIRHHTYLSIDISFECFMIFNLNVDNRIKFISDNNNV